MKKFQRRVVSHYQWFGEMEAELRAGQSHVSVGLDGPTSITRVVKVVALHLTDHKGHVLLQLGQCVDGRCDGKVNLPGCKMLGHESPEDALKRLIDEHLRTLADAIQIVAMKTVLESGFSSSFGSMRSKYIRYVYDAELNGALELDTVVMASFPISTEWSRRSPGSAVTAITTASQGSKDKGIFSTHSGRWMFGNLMKSQQSQGPAFAGALGVPPFPTMTEDGASAMAVQECKVGAELPPFMATPIRLYRWLDASDVKSLLARRAEHQVELTPFIRRLQFQDWRVLLSWRLSSSSSPNYLSTGSLVAAQTWAREV
eukprot:4941096-Amphidinium_carterae.1